MEHAALDDRIAWAWRAFWSVKSQLQCKRARYALRLRLLNSTVFSVFSWGMTTEDMTRHVLEKTRHMHNRMLRITLHMFKGRDMSWVEYHDDCRVKIDEALRNNCMESWDKTLCRQHWRAMGLFARMEETSLCYSGLRAGGL